MLNTEFLSWDGSRFESLLANPPDVEAAYAGDGDARVAYDDVMAAPLAAVKTLRRDTTSLIGGCVDREDAESMQQQIRTSRRKEDAEALMIAAGRSHRQSEAELITEEEVTNGGRPA